MTLTLTIRNFDRLDNGMPTEFVLHRRGALIGRSPTCDWSLPDPRNYISSRHAEIGFADGFYSFSDISMNGTLLNGSTERMPSPHRIANGDVFVLGQYEVAASLTGEAIAAVERDSEAAAAAQQSNWTGWDGQAGGSPAPPAAPGGWDSLPEAAASPADSGWGAPPSPSSSGWAPQSGPGLARPEAHRAASFGAPPAVPPASVAQGWAPSASVPLPVASAWAPHVEKAQEASGWSSAAPDRPVAASPDDIWGKIAEGNVVDWARGGFGQPIDANPDPLGLSRPDPRDALSKSTPQMAQFGGNVAWGPAAAPATSHAAPSAPPPRAPTAAPVSRPAPPPAPVAAPARQTAAAPPPTAIVQAFLTAAGMQPGQVADVSPALLDHAGQVLRRLVAGLVVMMEARARAKSQMGAEATSFTFDGNNPIKFARTPEDAVAALLNPPARGFMESGRAIEDAYFDLQSHQMATLRAMQGALRATLDRFSPISIRKRAETGGFLAKILPGARDAALWQAYEREFGGVAQGSDEAFMDVFAKEFRKAYEEQGHAQRKG